ncbi:MAG: hypothetical protein IPK26_20865 [Planctomycetes bacterium]|nr:hypothetical protein [Planctomycetota bacterium]
MRTKAEVKFVVESTGADRPDAPTADSDLRATLGTLTSLGPLTGEDLETAVSLAQGLLGRRQDQLASWQRTMDRNAPRDAFEEARRLHAVEVAMVVQKCLRDGDYIVLPQGQAIPDNASDSILSFGLSHTGRPASVFFVLFHDKYPELASLKQYMVLSRETWLDDLVARFNNQGFNTRREMIQRESRLSSRPVSEISADDRAYREMWFPIGVQVDPDAAVLRRVPVRIQ